MARLACGFTQASFATSIGISQSLLSKLEDGLRRDLPEDKLASMVSLTGFPETFFTREGGRRAMSDDLFRKSKAAGAKVLAQNDALVNIRRLEIETLLPKVEFETLPRPHCSVEDFAGGAREIARNLRHAWRLDQGPIENLTKLAEDIGCIVIHFDFGTSKIDGLTSFANDGTPIIFLNPAFPAARLRATLAHEIGHVIMHHFMTATADEEAWQFAYELLMPEREIRPSLFPLNIDKLVLLKNKWKVSMQFILMWAREMGALKDGYFRVLMCQISKRGWRKLEPFDGEWLIEQPTFLREIIDYHLKDLGYTEDELRSSMAANERTFGPDYLGRPSFTVL